MDKLTAIYFLFCCIAGLKNKNLTLFQEGAFIFMEATVLFHSGPFMHVTFPNLFYIFIAEVGDLPIKCHGYWS